MKYFLSPNLDECMAAYCEGCRKGNLPVLPERSCATCSVPMIADNRRWMSLTVARGLCGQCKIFESGPNAPARVIDDILDLCEHRDCPLSEVILIRDWDAGFKNYLIEKMAEERPAHNDDTAKIRTKPKQKARRQASTAKK